jgi:hypothetical protein
MATQVTAGGTQTCRSACIGLLVGLLVTLVGVQATAQRPAEGTLILGMPCTITPALLNPAETTGQTAAMFHYALHDALLDLLPGHPMATALAESWTESPDGLTYEFTLCILERATWLRAWREKQLKGLVLAESPTLGNAATRIELYVLGTGPSVYGSDPDLDALFQEQTVGDVDREVYL